MPLNTQQKSAVSQFTAVTDSDRKTAEKLLKQYSWNVQRAIDGYYAVNTPSHPTVNTSALIAQFDRYRDNPREEPNLISIEGAQKYLADLRLSPDQFEVLVLQTLLGCPALATFKRDLFTAGWTQHNATTPQQQLHVLTELTKTLKTVDASAALPAAVLEATGPQSAASDSLFKRVYRHTFVLALPSDVPNVRVVPPETAIEFWRLLLGPASPCLKWVGKKHGTPLMELWFVFLTKSGKSVNRDLWMQTLAFAQKSVEDEELEFWSEEAAWPGLIDQFVKWMKEKREEKGDDEDVEMG